MEKEIVTLKEKLNVVGKPKRRVDAKEKVIGKALYVDDLRFPGMLYGKVKRSIYPRARIRVIDTSKAKALKGVVAVLTAKDIPGKNMVPIIVEDMPLLAEREVRYIGEALALVAASSKRTAEEALKLIKVDYEPLTPVTSPIDALKNTSPKIYGENNIVISYKLRKGDVESGFREADVIIEREYRTGYQEHVYLEPQGIIAVPGPNGSMVIYGSLQCPHYVQKAVSYVTGIGMNKVRVVQVETGGGFGGKEDVPSWVAGYTAVLAYRTNKPVKLIYDREEDILSTSKRHPAIIKYRTGAKKTGELTAVEVKYILDAGAYATLSIPVLWRGTVHAVGPYKCPNIKVDSLAVATNKVPCGAFRGFGTPQVIFAHESQMDLLAEEIGMDPIDLRLKNALEEGDQTATGQVLRESVGLKETIRRAAELSNWHRKRREYSLLKGVKRRGIGISTVFYGVSLGAAGKHLDKAASLVHVFPDGSVVVFQSLTEIGQGQRTVIAQIASESLGVKFEDVYVQQADTSIVPDSGPTVASRGTLMPGMAVIDACKRIKKRLAAVAAEMLNTTPENLVFENGEVYNVYKPGKGMLFKEVVKEAYNRRVNLGAEGWFEAPFTSFNPETGQGEPYFVYSYATHIAEVEVDVETGKVDVLKVTAVHDSGKIINPATASGQVEGGILQGLGYALMEELQEKDGYILNPNLTDYLIPTSMDAPEIEVSFVEARYSKGPFGAKGIGEPSIMPTAAAILNAVSHAIGVRVFSLPATPEKIYWTIKGSGRYT